MARHYFNPRTAASDAIAGMTLGIESIPDAMASALLAAVNPIHGVYAVMLSTPVGALFASEIRRAEAAMADLAGLPVELAILAAGTQVSAEVETSNAALSEIIGLTLNENLENSELVDFTFEVGLPFIVEATISTELEGTSDELLAELEVAEDALSDALGITVLLDITFRPEGLP